MTASFDDTGPIELLPSHMRRTKSREPKEVEDAAPVPREHTHSDMMRDLVGRLRDSLKEGEASQTTVAKVETLMTEMQRAATEADRIQETATILANAVKSAGGGKWSGSIVGALLAFGLMVQPVIERILAPSSEVQELRESVDTLTKTVAGLSAWMYDMDRCRKDPTFKCPEQPPPSVRIAAAMAEEDTSK